MASYAFVAGVNNYVAANDGLGKLGGAAGDAKDFIDWLKDSKGGNLPDANIFHAISPPNDEVEITLKSNATKEMEKLVNLLDADRILHDRLYFYFAGHGVGHPDQVDENLLCFSDWTKLWCTNAFSAVPAISFFRFLGVFQEIVFIFDCCRTRYIRATMTEFITKNVSFGDYKNASVVIAYATSYDDEAHEYDDYTKKDTVEKRGVFTKVLLKGLKGEAANEQGEVDHHSLSKYLTKEVNLEAQKNGFSQEPQFSVILGNGKDRILFSKFQTTITVEFNLKGPENYILNDSKDQKIKEIQVAVTGKITIPLIRDYYTIIRESDNESKVFRVKDSTDPGDSKIEITFL